MLSQGLAGKAIVGSGGVTCVNGCRTDIKELRASLSGLDRQLAEAREREDALDKSLTQDVPQETSGSRSKLVVY